MSVQFSGTVILRGTPTSAQKAEALKAFGTEGKLHEVRERSGLLGLTVNDRSYTVVESYKNDDLKAWAARTGQDFHFINYNLASFAEKGAVKRYHKMLNYYV